jgi:hypothetical protein
MAVGGASNWRSVSFRSARSRLLLLSGDRLVSDIGSRTPSEACRKLSACIHLVEKLCEVQFRKDRSLSYAEDSYMSRHSRWFSIPCLCCAIITAEDCRSASSPRAPAESPYTIVYRSAAPIEVDSTRRFQTKISVDSTLSSGEIAGTVVSASTGAPAPMVDVWIDYPAHRHTERLVHTDAEGNFRIKGLPNETVILHASGLGFHPDSVSINPQTRSFVRFALPVTLVRLMY